MRPVPRLAMSHESLVICHVSGVANSPWCASYRLGVLALQVPVDDANKDGSRPSSAHLFTTTGRKKDGNMNNG